MDTTKFTAQSIVKLEMLNQDQLFELSSWCNNRARELEFERMRAEQIEREAKWKLQWEEEKAQTAALVSKLKKFIEPGTRLKMKGCRDRSGVREFIRWDGNNLVCWQILSGERTDCVTTHMPDKVTKVFKDGKIYPVRSLPA